MFPLTQLGANAGVMTVFLWVTIHIKFLYNKAAQKMAGSLSIHTSGFNCDWLKAVVVKEIVIFSTFCSLCCYNAENQYQN